MMRCLYQLLFFSHKICPSQCGCLLTSGTSETVQLTGVLKLWLRSLLGESTGIWICRGRRGLGSDSRSGTAVIELL